MKKALVMGIGASGAACAAFLARRGWAVDALDTRQAPPGLARFREAAPQGRFLGSDMTPAALEGVDLLVMSPGLSPEHSAAAPVVRAARSRGVEVVGEIELFARELERLKAERGYEPRVIAVTGTNGKTTTTSLAGRMVADAGRSVCVAGNIGPNACAELDRLLAEDRLPEYWVLELSSFQLETTSSLACASAAYLNLTQDHVDWHGGMEAYAAAKRRIFKPGTVRVLNRGDAETMKAAEEGEAVQSFGEDAPLEPGQWGLARQGALVWLARRPAAASAGRGRKAQALAEDGGLECMMPADALRIRGRHNAMNALAALALVTSAGVPLASALSTLSAYRGEPHRVQFVLETRGVEFIDDSKGTNVGATAAALAGLGAGGRKCSLILGGDGKGQDFSPIAEAVAAHARHVVLIGRDAELIAEAIKASGVPVERAGTDFEKAVDMAWAAARPGDAVLLSPACASWDMFANYAERASRFVERARAIAMDNGSLPL